ncbi:MAG: carbon-nitrogen hydrolase family protein [Anaerolineae bacterium]
MREVKIALVQMAPRLGEVGENLARMAKYVEEISLEQRVDLILFPELATTGYENGVRFTDLAEKVPGHAVNLMAQQAREFNTHIVFGMPVKEKVESIIYDALVMIGPDGDVMGDYRKLHPRGEERLAFRPGFKLDVFPTAFGNVGLVVGWDLAFPEVTRVLALEGAELLCVGASFERPYVEDWETYLSARALENSVFVAAANRVGEDPGYDFFGRSAIRGPRGEEHASLDDDVEGYVVGTVDLDDVRKYREEFQLFQIRQPTAYRMVVKRY